jgi:UPF0755 protein
MAVTERNPPPDGSGHDGSQEGALPPATSAAAPAADNQVPATGESAAKFKSAFVREMARTRGAASMPIAAGLKISGQEFDRASESKKGLQKEAERTRNLSARAPAPSAPASRTPRTNASAAHLRKGGMDMAERGAPRPPLSQRPVNAIGAPQISAKNLKPLTPRSPREALEPERVDAPPRRSRSVRNPLVVIGNALISVFILAAIAGGFALVAGKQRFDAPGPLPEDRVVSIPRGAGIRDIADVLMREGVIDQPWVFVAGVLVLKAREDLKAGEYQFKAHSSLRDVVATIVEGRVVVHQFTIPEGLTSEQIVARLLDDDVLAGNIKEIPREGSLLPDTYNFTRGTTREQMIQRMQQAQQRALKEIWEHRSPDLPLKIPDQLVILASLVEKETGKPEERTRIAAVFVNRLKQKMKLQSDPTIIYGLVGGKGTLGRPITKSEIDQVTPYNTYQIDGLPPGPITNPGRASLEAAANPARTRELYFVADGTGGHAFAETYEQHQRNVARLRQIEGEQKDQAPADAQQASSPSQIVPPPVSSSAVPSAQRRTTNRHSQSPQAAH